MKSEPMKRWTISALLILAVTVLGWTHKGAFVVPPPVPAPLPDIPFWVAWPKTPAPALAMVCYTRRKWEIVAEIGTNFEGRYVAVVSGGPGPLDK